jgi:pullulanase
MHKLANAIVLTSQSVPFLHAGVEMCRTKGGNSNSYKSPDSVNAIDWSRKAKYEAVFNYYRDLIALRKAHPAFRMPTGEMVQQKLKFIDTNDGHLVAFSIGENANQDAWKKIIVAYNGSAQSKQLSLPEGEWTQAVDGNSVSEEGLRKIRNTLNLPGISAAVLYAE